MKTKVQRWGNSLALRIPKPFALEARLENGSSVELLLEEGRLIISRPSEARYVLNDLLHGITPDNIHREFDTGGPVGDEVW